MALTRPTAVDFAARLFGASPSRRLVLLRAAWPLATGAELAQRTEVVAVEGNTLRVRVADASWRKELVRMRGPLIGRLRRVAGALAPERLAFLEGPLANPTRPSADRSTPSPVAAPAPPVLEAARAIEDVEIREGFLAVAARYLSRSHP